MVKVIETSMAYRLEEEINSCIEEHKDKYKLKDIKFSSSVRKTGSYSDTNYAAILIFEQLYGADRFRQVDRQYMWARDGMRHVRKRSEQIIANVELTSEDVVAMDSVLAEAKIIALNDTVGVEPARLAA